MALRKKLCSRVSVIICALQIMYSTTRVEPYNRLLDRISSLPGQPKVKFHQYAGYVNVDEKHDRSYFYYFAEAENDPASKPLVLWLFGGPGCSSVGVGAFTGNGPFKPRGNILVKNEYSWNKVANMLYLESPAGVGFSYSADKSFYKSVNDTITAADNFNFLTKWFDKYPQYKKREFFITGESYIGHYATQLAHLIVGSKSKFINLKGIALGNPLLEFNTDYNGRAEYLWSHGIISDSTLDLLNSVCSYSKIVHQTRTGDWTKECSKANDQLTSEVGKYVDIFDVSMDICQQTVSSSTQSQQDEPKIAITCVIDNLKLYLRRKDVQKALHARLVGVSNWNICSTVMNYDRGNLEIPTIGLVGKLVKAGIQVLAYSGDQDALFAVSGTRKLINRLANDLNLKTTRPYGAWMSNNQVSGWTQGYGTNNILSFATVRGASHNAPYSQPERSLVLFTLFISGKSLPPPPG